MARPARVRMRRRKPCVLARRRLFGWKVRLLTRFSVGCRGPSERHDDVGPAPVLGAGGGRCDRNRQARGEPRWSGEAGSGAMGMRKRSQTRSVNDTGAVERGSNRQDARGDDARRTRKTPDPRTSGADCKATRRRRERSVGDSIVIGASAPVGWPLPRLSTPMHRLWTNMWTTGHRARGHRWTQVVRPGRFEPVPEPPEPGDATDATQFSQGQVG